MQAKDEYKAWNFLIVELVVLSFAELFRNRGELPALQGRFSCLGPPATGQEIWRVTLSDRDPASSSLNMI